MDELEATDNLPPVTPFSVFKDAKGQYRWIGITATAYRDRDGEIISTAALAEDVERMDKEGRYGPLRWWHLGESDPTGWATKEGKPWGTGLDIGDCDFSWAMGPYNIESGTFYSPLVAQAVAAKAADLRFSKGFHYGLSHKEGDTYKSIRTFERSLLPRGTESNLLTDAQVVEVQMATNAEKLKMLEELVGPEAAGATLDALKDKEGLARLIGIAKKERVEEEEKAKKPSFMKDDEGEDEEEEDKPMKPKGKAAEVPDLEAVLKSALASQLSPLFESQKAVNDGFAQALKETSDRMTALEERLKELVGEQPRLASFRASQSGQEPREALKATAPAQDSPVFNLMFPQTAPKS